MDSRFSIALATCNGEKYLAALLDSIARQKLPPTELVASDDASEDGTLTLLEAFAACAPFPVCVLRQPERLGVVGNFSRAIAACGGEIIALADQDDVWHTDKLEKLATALASPEVLAAFSDADVVDADLSPLGYTMWQRVRFTPYEQERMRQGEAFEVLLKHRIVTGAALAFKSELRDLALPIPDGWPHDAWLAQLAAAEARLVALSESLVAYRQHETNAVGGRRRTFFEEAQAAFAVDRAAWYRGDLAQWQALEARLGERAPFALRDKIDHLHARAALPALRLLRVPVVLNELIRGRYRSYARNWGSAAVDLLVK